MSEKPYRKNVGVVVFNARGQVLVGERLNYRDVFQFPQGGLDAGEQPEVAARRELYEETGLELDGPPVFEIEQWLRYDFPPDIPKKLKKYRGQEQKWFFYFWDGTVDELNLDVHEREFESVRWDDFTEIVEKIVEFKRPVYREVLRLGQPAITAHLAGRAG